MATTTTRITAADQARRRHAIGAARHSTEMEGGRATVATQADQEAYVAGEITLEQLGQRVRSRYGVA